MDSVSSTAVAPAPAAGAAVPFVLPELIAPAGNMVCARAAIENGADAIYFGLERHNARLRADNFSDAGLPQLMEYLHRRGARGYVCFNTLIFPNELEESEKYLRSLIAAGVDAIIIQDVGVGRLVRRMSPDVPLHASTQMTITSAAGVEFARDLGCQLVVLARECSLKDIKQIQEGCKGALPLEVFIHGALCVAYSGQCLTSEALGGRSANRGVCAQACRMPYDLVSDGQVVPLGDRRYLLSPQDLAGLELLPDLARLGVASLKIEGRLKTPEYVANITRIYREALTGLAKQCVQPGVNPDDLRVDPTPFQYDMEMSFSRGLYTGWFKGINNQELVHARFGKKRGVFLGTVKQVRNAHVYLDLEGPLKLGDGVVFDAGRPDLEEEGGRIYEISPTLAGQGKFHEVALAFGHTDINWERVQVGDKLWKTSDPEAEKRWRQSFAGDAIRYQRPVSVTVSGRAGEPLRLVMKDEGGHEVAKESRVALVVAENQPLTDEKLTAQLGRLGGTPFRLGTLQNLLEGQLMLPVSELNRLRRELVEDLDRLRAQRLRWQLQPGPVISGGYWAGQARPAGRPSGAAELIVLVRNLPQLAAALRCGITTLYCEFDDPKQYREGVFKVREAGNCASAPRSIWVAPPRVFKPGEEWILKQVRSCDADGYLVRNYDHLRFFGGDRCIGDYSLNVANALSAEYFRKQCKLERVTASYDLNFDQLGDLLNSAPADWFEITIHQHMPMFHMEHCVFCAFLSKGTDYTNCGRPCDHHAVKLRDRVGAEHPVKADAGCRNTVFNSMAQTGADGVVQLMALGARHFRVEFVDEPPAQVESTIAKYRQLLRGEINGGQVWQELKLLNQLGVTRGQMNGRQG
jgi:putative protease